MTQQSMYLKTRDMARLIGYSPDYLLQNREILFTRGVHYFPKMNSGKPRIDWKVDAVLAWVEGKELSSKAKSILDLIS